MAKTTFNYSPEGENYEYLLDLQTNYKKKDVKMSLARIVDIIITRARQMKLDQGVAEGAAEVLPE